MQNLQTLSLVARSDGKIPLTKSYVGHTIVFVYKIEPSGHELNCFFKIKHKN